MATLSQNKGLQVPVVSSDSGAWGTEINADITAFDQLLGGTLTLNASAGNVTLNSSVQAYNLLYSVTGTSSSGSMTITFPSSTAGGGIYVIDNETTSTTLQVTQSSSLASPLTVPSGGRSTIVGNGTTFQFADNAHYEPSTINYIFSGFGQPLSSGVVSYVEVGFNCTINAWELLADQTGNITIDIWKSSFGGFPPSSANSITGSSQPNISSASKSQNSTLTGWTTTVNAGDILAFTTNTGSSTITKLDSILSVNKT